MAIHLSNLCHRPSWATLKVVLLLCVLGCSSKDAPQQTDGSVPSKAKDRATKLDESNQWNSAQLLASIKTQLPRLSRPHSYVGSQQCRECHPSEHASWHSTYHRTMTQLALPANVMGEFNGQEIESAGLKYRVFRKGDEYWAAMPDPDRMLDYGRGDPRVDPATLPIVERQVVMTTGSHHYQTYWVAHSELGSVMNTLPLVYLPKEKRWIPREAAFISPPDAPRRMITIWNDHCINCHSTGGNPGLKGPKVLDTSVGELGIACESCHGPGENHVLKHHGQTTNIASTSRVDLVNPKDLDHVRSSQVCGQCHGVFIRQGKQGMKFAKDGVQFRPGEDLDKYRHYIEFPDENPSPQQQATFEKNREFYRERWWDDGTILAGGREYTAMQRTGCYSKGKMSCLSCHSMHSAEPDDQLKEGMRENHACIQCHQEAKFTTDLTSHTHHAESSSGSSCLNCHMPHTSYALFKGIRNHTINSPNIQSSVKHGVPNACNLCHLDKSLAWTQDSLVEWYGAEPMSLNEQERTIPASALWVLKGDAAQRAVVAWHFGWQPAKEVAGTEWMVPVMAQLLSDPYGVVRHITETAIRSWPEHAEFDFDFLASNEEWLKSKQLLIDSAQAIPAGQPKLDMAVIESLLRQRDNRPVSIKE